MSGAGAKVIAVTGASGLIGSALARALRARGDRVLRLTRRGQSPAADEVRWSPLTGEIDAKALDGIDAFVHLAGENIASGRWNRARKIAILRSRAAGTGLVAQTLAALERPPKVLVSASAIGFYGDRRDEILTEESAAGTGFLADICRDWETAAAPARTAGIRVVHPRIGMVLSTRGGALAKLLPLFRSGLGGPIGSGRQYMSCIGLGDLVRALLFLIDEPGVKGAVNAVLPAPLTNADFTKTLGRVLRRPAILPVPAFAVSLLFGEMGRELLLGGARALPAKLEASGFAFHHNDVESALRAELGSEASEEGRG